MAKENEVSLLVLQTASRQAMAKRRKVLQGRFRLTKTSPYKAGGCQLFLMR
jgi:hypothetical protein